MRITYEQVKHWQEFQILLETLKAGFGGGTSSTDKSPSAGARPVQNMQEARAALEAVLGKR